MSSQPRIQMSTKIPQKKQATTKNKSERPVTSKQVPSNRAETLVNIV